MSAKTHSNDDTLRPLAVMFAVYGTRTTSKLLFKYPFGGGSTSSAKSKLCPSSKSYPLHKSSSGLFQKESLLMNSSEPVGGTAANAESDSDDHAIDRGRLVRDEMTQLKEFTDETLGHMLTPHNMSTCGRKFDVKINGLWFVGFPFMLEQSNLDSNRPHPTLFKTPVTLGSSSSHKHKRILQSEDDHINVLYFNVVFVLKTSSNYSVGETFQDLSAKIGLALRFEEQRDRYVSNQTRFILNLFEAEEDAQATEQVYRKVLHNSSLARFLKDVLKSMQNTGIVELSLNEHLRISFCSYPKLHKLSSNHNPTPTTIERTLQNIQPYHGIFVYDIEDVYSCLTAYSSSSIHIFLQIYKPTMSLSSIAMDAGIPLQHVYTVVRHLVAWGKACIIYPLCETNIYMIAPTAVLDTDSEFVEQFLKKFSLNLHFVLYHFSTPVRLGDLYTPTGLFCDDQNKLIRIVFWMLRHRFLVQHHTYVLFLPSAIHRSRLDQVRNGLIRIAESNHNSRRSRIELGDLPAEYQCIFQRIEAAQDPQDLADFVRFLRYFDGKHHLEEMMYKENVQRLQLLTVLDKFNNLLVTSAREDAIASHYRNCS